MTPRVPTGSRFSEGEGILAAPAEQVARWLRGTGVVESLGSSRCRVRLGSWSWAGLAAIVGMFDVELEIVGPPELRVAAAQLAPRYAASCAS